MRGTFIPVYLITGFLESGKTTMGLSVLGNDRFTNGGRVLVLCCEEGETEYEPETLEKYHATLVNLERKDELNSENLAKINRQVKPDCVIMEYNSMWGIGLLGELRLPLNWDWAQIVTVADATTFENYMTNMRVLMTDPMKEADLIIVNRCPEDFNKSGWRKQIRAMNAGATVLFENLDGTVDDGIRDEDLPYDMKADVIEISEDQFGTLYLDTMDHPDRYDGKTIRLVGQAYQRRGFPKGFYYFGRKAMTCCSNDIAACGWVCKGNRKADGKTFFTLTARAELMHAPDGQTALMLHEIQTDRAKTPRDEYVSFVNL